MMDTESKTLPRIRSEVCDAILIWLALAGPVAVVAVALMRPAFISTRMLIGHGVLVAFLVVVALFRRRLPYTLRAGAVLTMGAVVGITRLVLYGTPYGLVDFALTIIMTTVFFGERAGIGAMALFLVSVASIFFGFTHGYLPPPGHPPPVLVISTWIVSAGVLTATTFGPMIALSRYGQQLDLERQNAEASSMAKSQFLATMSHELRTPLNAIMGFADAMSLGYAGPPDSTRYLEYTDDIRRSAKLLLTIVDDLLDLARVDALQYKAQYADLDVATELEKAVMTVNMLADNAGLILELDVAPRLPPMRADPKLCQQILLNLLGNAIKFTPDGGKVTVRAQQANAYVRIEVTDTGIGIPADQIPSLAQPFRQATHPTVRNKAGSGLGLALAKSFTELQSGSLEIRSKVGMGTTIVVHLPVAQIAPPIAEA